jgi:hypothetical protein
MGTPTRFTRRRSGDRSGGIVGMPAVGGMYAKRYQYRYALAGCTTCVPAIFRAIEKARRYPVPVDDSAIGVRPAAIDSLFHRCAQQDHHGHRARAGPRARGAGVV